MASVTYSNDVLTEILIKIPVKSIVRFRCVCKSWRSLIRSRAFIRTHLDYATNVFNVNVAKNRYSSAIFYFRSTNRFSFEYQKVCQKDQNLDLDLDLDEDEQDEVAITSTVLDLPSELREKTVMTRAEKRKMELSDPGCEIMACCDGMLCIKTQDSIVLWNPLIHDYVRLPPPRIKFDCAEVIWIGYDPTVDEYKVFCAPSSKIRKSHRSVEVLGLKSKSWKKLVLDEVPYEVICSRYPAFTNNGMHWFALRAGTTERMILCFDFIDQKFREVPQPPQSSSVDYSPIYGLRVMNKKLCVVNYKQDRFQIWMMTKYGVKESWIEIIDPLYSKYLFPSYIKGERSNFNDQLLRSVVPITDRIRVFLQIRELLIYKAVDKTSETVYFCDACSRSNRVPYVETLVSPSTK